MAAMHFNVDAECCYCWGRTSLTSSKPAGVWVCKKRARPRSRAGL